MPGPTRPSTSSSRGVFPFLFVVLFVCRYMSVRLINRSTVPEDLHTNTHACTHVPRWLLLPLAAYYWSVFNRIALAEQVRQPNDQLNKSPRTSIINHHHHPRAHLRIDPPTYPTYHPSTHPRSLTNPHPLTKQPPSPPQKKNTHSGSAPARGSVSPGRSTAASTSPSP